jgi:alkyl sulfatase BDS1-like metallo-beta-lactamase superfamily hydrolase
VLTASLKAFTVIAAETINANERSYLLIAVVTENGSFSCKNTVAAILTRDYAIMPTDKLLAFFRIRLDAQRSKDVDLKLKIDMSDDEGSYFWTINNSVLRNVNDLEKVDGTVAMSRSSLISILAGSGSFRESTPSVLVTIAGLLETQRLADFIE